jgi:DNA mismatch endonuclease (patch repair protein)
MERYLKTLLKDGAFTDVDPTRSHIMGRIKSKSNRSTEATLRMALVRCGIRGWRLNASDQFGKPDFFFDEKKIAVFVDGCFWHGCGLCGHTPKTRSEFWAAKFKRNRQRDRRSNRTLVQCGVRVIRIWEHSLKDANKLDSAVYGISKALAS